MSSIILMADIKISVAARRTGGDDRIHWSIAGLTLSSSEVYELYFSGPKVTVSCCKGSWWKFHQHMQEKLQHHSNRKHTAPRQLPPTCSRAHTQTRLPCWSICTVTHKLPTLCHTQFLWLIQDHRGGTWGYEQHGRERTGSWRWSCLRYTERKRKLKERVCVGYSIHKLL